jgi:hypothetical protein
MLCGGHALMRNLRTFQDPARQVAQQPADVAVEGGTFVDAAVRHLAHSSSRGNVIE